MTLDTYIHNLSGIGPKLIKKLNRLGIHTIGDFVHHFPSRYEDFSQIKKIADVNAEEKTTIVGQIISIGNSRTWRKKMMVTEALIKDDTATIRATWFNQPFLTQALKKGLWVNFSGKTKIDNNGLYLSNPSFEVIGTKNESTENIHTRGLIPVYPETRGLTSRWLRFKIKSLLNSLGYFEDFLPQEVKSDFDLVDLDKALRSIHFPKSKEEAEQARKRLAFDELFLLQIFGALEKKKIKNSPAPKIKSNIALTKEFVGSLPFDLTDSQRQAAWQIIKDMEAGSPMNRLLEGDVGSGKTVVAVIASLNAISRGWQVAYLAPTEILAQQHFKTISQMLTNFHREVALLTSSTCQVIEHGELSKKTTINLIKSGEIQMVIGTHAIIQKNVEFKNLGLVITDEQHRFGVEQRAHLLRSQKLIPHLLSMTATPIPRTLALTLYGDLDLSLLKEMPKGRKKIITKIVPPAKRNEAYKFIKEQIKKGRQAFVICPLIEESEKLEVKSVTQEYEKLSRKVFPSLNVGMLHGKMKPKEKEEIMKQFKRGKMDLLISTAVIEVGIDVPNATVMMIEGADRFGLAQLHQFRGRVGRSEYQSYCFLFTDSAAKATGQRLKALVESENGFALAEKDLQIRGPGQFFGTQQSGLPDLAMASLKDIKLIEEAQKATNAFIEKSSLEDHPKLAAKIAEFKKEVHWE